MLKRSLLASVGAVPFVVSALAADLPAAAPPPPPTFTWTGVYLGGQIGYGWGEDSSNIWLSGPLGSVAFPATYTSGSTQTEGVIGGAHIGYNWQINQFVLGLEGRVDGTSLSKSTQPVYHLQYNVTTAAPVQGAILGRVGYAFDRTLVYATGGGVYSWIQNTYNVLGINNSFSTSRSGWTVGGGVEYGVDNNWSLRAEYRYTKLGYTYDGTIVFPNVFQSHRWTQNQVQVGFSYKFTPAPPAAVVAKY
ncbi:porin family protein [Methylocapsa polymorpha]|uniref:Porin family protein n=1 Tax=Methylocapsa polymorpha TaxID=3080828 RepID=A0ABZ0HWE8_9HYPH|nr:porin family protein [Methylocapsa sp. RX1]